MMILLFRWARVVLGYLFFMVCAWLVFRHELTVYLLQQAKGQLRILTGTTTIGRYMARPGLSEGVKANILLVDSLKRFSVDSLGYLPTGNFTRIYDQSERPVLWVVTASGPFDLEPYEWEFPVVGRVSYKGFFEKSLACREYIRLTGLGYDAAIRSVSAWSTLGWFNDPLLSNVLLKSRGSMCNLVFHELFHATCYVPGQVNLNENLANFIAHKATIKFLQNDTLHLGQYLRHQHDARLYRDFLKRQYSVLKNGYRSKHRDSLQYFRKQVFRMIADSAAKLPFSQPGNYASRQKDILRFRNAYFVDLKQYESLQDSLEIAFNKIYKGNIKNMVQDLKSQ